MCDSMKLLLVDKTQTGARRHFPTFIAAYDRLNEKLDNRRIRSMIGRNNWTLIEECRESEKTLHTVVDVLLTTRNIWLADSTANFFRWATVDGNLDVRPIRGKLEQARDRLHDADIRGKLNEALLADSQRQLALAL